MAFLNFTDFVMFSLKVVLRIEGVDETQSKEWWEKSQDVSIHDARRITIHW